MGLDEFIKQYIDQRVDEKVDNVIKSALAENNYHKKEDSTSDEHLIRGLSGLAKFLNVSIPTAQKLKNSKVFPYYQWGRILVFKKQEVLAGMESKRKSRL